MDPARSKKQGPQTDAANVSVDVQLAASGNEVPAVSTIRQWVTQTIQAAGVDERLEVSVRVVDASEMRTLNRRYRDRDRATNVLSFPAGPVAGMPHGEIGLLGDVVICAPVAGDEAAVQEKGIDEHWAHLLVHGTLHLLGYDHGDDDSAREMESLEVLILQSFGISNPYRSA